MTITLSDRLRYAEAAALLGVGTTTLNNYVNSGKLKAVRIGSRVYVCGESLRRLIEARQEVRNAR